MNSCCFDYFLRVAFCFTFFIGNFVFAQTSALTVIMQDNGINSSQSVNNIDLYSVPTSGANIGQASYLANYQVAGVRIASNGAKVASSLLTLPLHADNGGFALATLDYLNGNLLANQNTFSANGPDQVINNLAACAQYYPFGVATYYNANGGYGLSIFDWVTGFVFVDPFGTNFDLPWLSLPVDQAFDCANINLTLYQAIEVGSTGPTLPTYSIRKFTYDPISFVSTSQVIASNLSDQIFAIKVRNDGNLLLVRSGATNYVEIRNANNFSLLGVSVFPTGYVPLMGLSSYDAQADLLYVAAANYSATNQTNDIIKFDLANFAVSNLFLQGFFAGNLGAQFAAIEVN